MEEEAGGGEEEVDFQQTVTCYQPLLREEDNVSSEDFPPRSPPFWDHTIWSHQNIFSGEEEDVLASLAGTGISQQGFVGGASFTHDFARTERDAPT